MSEIKRPDGRTFGGLVKIDCLGYWVNFSVFSLYPKDLRKLSKWLLQAADYIEETKGLNVGPRRRGKR